MKRLFLLLVLIQIFWQVIYAQTDRYWVGGGDTNWNNAANWAATSGGAGGETVPNANSFRVIFDINSGSPTVYVNIASFSLQQFWITDDQSVTLISSGGNRTITIGDATDNNILGASVTSADLVVESGSTLIIEGTATNSMAITQNNHANSKAVFVGTVQVNSYGALTKAGTPTLTFNAGAKYIHNRDGGTIVTATWDATSTCEVTGVTSTLPGGLVQTFGNLTWNCSSQSATININPSGDITVAGTFWIKNTNNQIICLNSSVGATRNFNITNFTQDDGTLDLCSNNINAALTLFNISGSLTQNSGTITRTATGGTNLLNHRIVFTSSGNQEPAFNGTVDPRVSLTINKDVAGDIVTLANSIEVARFTLTQGTLSFGVSDITLTVNDNFTFSNGTIDMSGSTDHILNLKGTTNTYSAGTLTTGSDNQEILYSADGAQNVMSLTYWNLGFDGSGTKTLSGTITVGKNLSILGSATLYTNTHTINGNGTGSLTMATGTILQLGNTGNATNVPFPTNFLRANISLNSSSIVVYQANTTQSISDVPRYGNLTLSTNTVKTLTGVEETVYIDGNLTINAGSFNLGTTATSINISGSATITGSLIFGNTSVQTVDIDGDLSGGTINMSGGSLLHTLNLGGATNTLGTLTTAAVGSTINYNLNDNQTVFANANYRNLTFSGSGVKTLSGNITVNNNLSIEGSATLYTDVRSIIGNASGTFSMADGTTLQLGNTGLTTNVLFPSNFTNDKIFLDQNSTIVYQNSSIQTVSGVPTYGNLTISSGTTKTLTGGVAPASIQGDLTVSAGTFNLGTTATTVNILGNATIDGTLAFGGTSTKVVSITGDLLGAGILDMSGGPLLHT